MTYNFEKVTENKWFGFVSSKDLTTEEYINNICVKKPLTILIQSNGDNTVALYGIIKKIGIFSFTRKDNNFFADSKIELKENDNGVITYIINSEQNIEPFIECLNSFMTSNGKNVSVVSFIFYETEIEQYI